MSTVQTDNLAKISRYLLVFVLVSFLLYFGKTLFIPMFYGLFIAMVMYPVCKWMELRRVPKGLAVTISLLIVIALFAGLVWLLGWQLSLFRKDIPGLIQKLTPALAELQIWLEEKWNISMDTQRRWLQSMAMGGGNTGSFLQNALNATTGALFGLFITPIFAALFLYNRRPFVKFLRLLTGRKYQQELNQILNEVVHTYFNYVKGMVLVYLIVGILNSIGLLALGIENAILFGMLTAIMTIIPYAGIIISSLLPISVAFITKDSILYPLGVVAIFSFVQYLEANVIFPKVVGNQLNVSTWATLVAIIAGGILWGVSGMILFIPFVAILKIITDHIDEWKPLNVLVSRGDT